MFFKKKTAAPALPSVRIRSGEKVIYEGLLKVLFTGMRSACASPRNCTRSSLVKLPENPGGFCLPTRIFRILPPASFSESTYLSRK